MVKTFSVTTDMALVTERQVLMANVYIHVMSIYGIRQFRVNNFTKAAQVFTYSVSSIASINQISVSRLY